MDAVELLVQYGVSPDRYPMYMYIGRDLYLKCQVIAKSYRVNKSGRLVPTLLLSNTDGFFDHLWIDQTSYIPTSEVGDTLYIKGKVKLYTKLNGERSFGLTKIRIIPEDMYLNFWVEQ